MDLHGPNLRGKFWPQRISSIEDDPWIVDYEGRLVYDEDAQALYFASSSEWVKITSVGDLFNIGQKLIFLTTLPTGWNIDAEADDRIILVTTTGDQVGDTGGSWVISGMNDDGLHDHFTPDQMSNPTSIGWAGASEIYSSAGTKTHKHIVVDGGLHSHGFQGTWRPENALFAVGVYQG